MKRENEERRVRRPELPTEVFAAVHRVLDYLWAEQERQFWNAGPKAREGHLFSSLALVRQWLGLPVRRNRSNRRG
jgi:hypothetical protein